MRCTSSRAARGRTATPRASTVVCEMSSWRWRSSMASGMPGHSQLLGETNTTPSGHTARWVTRPRPGSPPRVRLPPRPRPRLQPHTLVPLVTPVPEPSYRLVHEIQPGHTLLARLSKISCCTPRSLKDVRHLINAACIARTRSDRILRSISGTESRLRSGTRMTSSSQGMLS